MLSIGIRFGTGFDKPTYLKFIQKHKMAHEFDFLVIGTNPGGVAVAKEASAAGKKVVIINWRTPSSAEELAFEEERLDKQKTTWRRKLRKSRIDIKNRITNLGPVARKLMRNAALQYYTLNEASKCGWKTPDMNNIAINWMEMTDVIIDYVIQENWKIHNDLSDRRIECIEGTPVFEDDHTVIVSQKDGNRRIVTAELICLALESISVVPQDIPGAREFCVTCDDFYRFEEPPGKTLIVGSGPVALECAGIIAAFQFSATVICKSLILKGCDREIVKLILEDMTERGVTFTQQATLKEVQKNKTGTKLLAKISIRKLELGSSGDGSNEVVMEEEFDTIIFALKRIVLTNEMNIDVTNIKLEPQTNRIFTNNEQTEVPHIFAVGEVAGTPKNYALSELFGRLLGRRLFHNASLRMGLESIPKVIFTPIEYAFIGLSEQGAISRFGQEYVDVYRDFFRPLDYILPPKKGNCCVKLIVLIPQDWVIGLHIFGPEAGEIIQGFVTAMKNGLTIQTLQTTIGIPTTKAYEIVRFKEKKFAGGGDETISSEK